MWAIKFWRPTAKDCPLYFNRDRDVEYLVSPQRFDAHCRRKLRSALGGKRLGALESLLSVFMG